MRIELAPTAPSRAIAHTRPRLAGDREADEVANIDFLRQLVQRGRFFQQWRRQPSSSTDDRSWAAFRESRAWPGRLQRRRDRLRDERRTPRSGASRGTNGACRPRRRRSTRRAQMRAVACASWIACRAARARSHGPTRSACTRPPPASRSRSSGEQRRRRQEGNDKTRNGVGRGGESLPTCPQPLIPSRNPFLRVLLYRTPTGFLGGKASGEKFQRRDKDGVHSDSCHHPRTSRQPPFHIELY